MFVASYDVRADALYIQTTNHIVTLNKLNSGNSNGSIKKKQKP